MENTFWIFRRFQQMYAVLSDYFFKHWIDSIILLFIVLVLALNCLKKYLIFKLRKNEDTGEKCKFLKVQKNGEQTCKNPYYLEQFKNKRSCFINEKRCKGFLLPNLSDTNIEEFLITTRWKYFVLCANWGTSILSYIAIIRTIVLAIAMKEVK